MEQSRRTLVAVVNGDAGVHTLYFSDGTVVGTSLTAAASRVCTSSPPTSVPPKP
jgi:hypothetical protein